jgi:hypothetical protein
LSTLEPVPGSERWRLAQAGCLALLAAFLLANCGGDAESPTEETREATAATTAPAEQGATSSEPRPTATEAEPELTTRAFQMPSRNIGCLVAEGFLRCDILSGLTPEPARECELDWVGLVLGAMSAAEPTCAGDTAYDQRARILAYGRTWKRGGFTCESRTIGLRCTNAAGDGFSLARAGWSTF